MKGNQENMLPEDIDKAEYAIVELVKSSDVINKKVTDLSSIVVERGLFLGIVVKKNKMFVVTTSNSSDIRLYNIDSYNISMIEYGTKDKKYYVIYTKDIQDQTDSVELLGMLLTSFKKRDMVFQEDSRFVDFDKLKHHDINKKGLVQTATEEVNKGAKKAVYVPDYDYDDMYGNMLGGINRAYNKRTNISNPINTNTYTDPIVTRSYEKKMTLFSRKSDKPNKNDLKAMYEKVIELFKNNGKTQLDNTNKNAYDEDDDDQSFFMSNYMG
jgi:hypothetical protein